MDDKGLLELCVRVTGAFENGVPTYWGIAGNFDGQGLSVGVLQWNAGSGTIQTLLTRMADKMGWDKMQTYFKSDIHHFAILKPKEAVQWCLDHYIASGSTSVDPAAKACWQSLLREQASIDAQVEYATATVLTRAKTLAATYCPDNPDSTRVIAFFFDLVTQSGGMENSKGKVEPLQAGIIPSVADALAYAQQQNLRVAAQWEIAIQNDPLAARLLYYAYHRSLLSKAEYVWDAFSRRGSIACRSGAVHGTPVNFSAQLD